MKTIKINSLKLTNFKGIRSLEINDLAPETSIFGDNGTGKTTIFDSFTWLLFGKDSSDRASFEVKTLDKNNQVIPQIDHEVEAHIEVNGERIELRRILREQWVKKRGALESEFSGNQTTYEWNGVPMNASEYSKKISDIVDEKVFKMITNPAAFNSLKWQDQRDVLIDMSGNITDADVIEGMATVSNKTEIAILTNVLNSGKSLDERKREVKASMTKSKNEIKAIPTRIDEVERAKPDVLDFAKLRDQAAKKQHEINSVNDQITDQLKAQQSSIDDQKKIKQEIQKLDFRVSDINHDYRMKAKKSFKNLNSSNEDLYFSIKEKQTEHNGVSLSMETTQKQVDSKKKDESQIADEMMDLREKWNKVNAEEFKMQDGQTECPTCKRDFDADKLEAEKEKARLSFDANKKTRLTDITSKGRSLKETLVATTKERVSLESLVADRFVQLQKVTEQLDLLVKELENIDDKDILSEDEIFESFLEKDDSIQPIKKEISTLTEQLQKMPEVNVDSLKDKRETLRTDLQSLERQINNEKEIDKHDKRIEQLSKEERALAQAIADIEKELFIIEAFEKEKSTRIEDSVNNRFQLVNFKLFETQINGGEVPTCKALINGVPFSDANTASKINAGLDIINTLCMHYKANAPIFIDNRESVIELIPTESQIINLIVSEADKKLRVESGVMAEAV